MSYRTSADHRVVTDGQSLNNYVVSPTGTNWTRRVGIDHNMLVANVAISGLGWYQLNTSMNPRVTQWLNATRRTVVVTMLGGHGDLWADHTAATCYADQVTYSTTVRALAAARGLAIKIVGTTTTPSTSFTAPEETIRVAMNSLIMADASNAYEYKVDLAADPRLTDPNNTTYYTDGTHPTPTGTGVITDLMRPAVLAAMRSLNVSV